MKHLKRNTFLRAAALLALAAVYTSCIALTQAKYIETMPARNDSTFFLLKLGDAALYERVRTTNDSKFTSNAVNGFTSAPVVETWVCQPGWWAFCIRGGAGGFHVGSKTQTNATGGPGGAGGIVTGIYYFDKETTVKAYVADGGGGLHTTYGNTNGNVARYYAYYGGGRRGGVGGSNYQGGSGGGGLSALLITGAGVNGLPDERTVAERDAIAWTAALHENLIAVAGGGGGGKSGKDTRQYPGGDAGCIGVKDAHGKTVTVNSSFISTWASGYQGQDGPNSKNSIQYNSSQSSRNKGGTGDPNDDGGGAGGTGIPQASGGAAITDKTMLGAWDSNNSGKAHYVGPGLNGCNNAGTKAWYYRAGFLKGGDAEMKDGDVPNSSSDNHESGGGGAGYWGGGGGGAKYRSNNGASGGGGSSYANAGVYPLPTTGEYKYAYEYFSGKGYLTPTRNTKGGTGTVPAGYWGAACMVYLGLDYDPGSYANNVY